MIESVDFISRVKAESMPLRENLIIISITEPDSGQASLAIPESRILRLTFHDVDPGNETDTRWVLFDERHAGEVVDFVRQVHAAPTPFDVVIHCRAGISRSAAIALFVEDETACEFPRRPFTGLANRHILSTLNKMAGRQIMRPRALPKREAFTVSVSRDFNTDQASVTVENARSGEKIAMNGPMLNVPDLVVVGLQRVWGIAEPPPSYHVADWDTLETRSGPSLEGK